MNSPTRSTVTHLHDLTLFMHRIQAGFKELFSRLILLLRNQPSAQFAPYMEGYSGDRARLLSEAHRRTRGNVDKMEDGKIPSDIRESVFTMRVVKHWSGVHRGDGIPVLWAIQTSNKHSPEQLDPVGPASSSSGNRDMQRLLASVILSFFG